MEQALTPKRLVSLLGGFPAKPPLDVKVLGAQESYTWFDRWLKEQSRDPL